MKRRTQPYKKFYRNKLGSVMLIDSFYGKALHRSNENFKKFTADWINFVQGSYSPAHQHQLDFKPIHETRSWKFMKKMT